MRVSVVALSLSLACVMVPAGPRVQQRPATAQIDPSSRDRAFSAALAAVQRHGWILAVSDRAGGILTTQTMSTGVQACGSITCDSRTAVQIAVSETGTVSVNIHREFYAPPPGTAGWFVPTLEADVRAIEAEERAVLAEIVP